MLSYQQWLKNVRDVVATIANRQMQEHRWLASETRAWETPEELINRVDDVVFDGFIAEFSAQFDPGQRLAAEEFQARLKTFCDSTVDRLDPATTLKDPQWRALQDSAADFLLAFPADNSHPR
jgi:hypothetical protein